MPILAGLRPNESKSPPEPSSPATPKRKSALSSRSKEVGTKESGASSTSRTSIQFEEPSEADEPEQPYASETAARDREGFSSKDTSTSSRGRRSSFSIKFFGASSEASPEDPGDARSHNSTKETTGSSGSGNSGGKERPAFGARKASNKSVRISSKRKSSKLSRKSSRTSSRTRSRSRSRSSGTGESWSSSSSEELTEQDFAGVDPNILPLYLREGAIVQSRASTKTRDSFDDGDDQTLRATSMAIHDKPVEEEAIEEDEEDYDDEDFEWEDNRSDTKKFLSWMLGYEQEEDETLSLLVPRVTLCYWSCPFFCWSVIMLVFLCLWVWRHFFEVRYQAHKVNALSAMISAETDMNIMLAPVYSVVRTIAFGARTGLMNTSDPFTALEQLVTTDMLTTPNLKIVRVVGAAKQVALVRPGTLHKEAAQETMEERVAKVFALSEMCLPSMPLACLSLDNPILLPFASSGASIQWQRPKFIDADMEGAPLEMSEWVLGYRLAAEVEVSGQMPLALEVTVAMRPISSLRNYWDDGPSPVTAFVCLKDGTLLTGNSWQAKASIDSHTREVVYPRLMDLQLPWASAVTEEMLLKQGESEGWHEDNLIMVRPLLGGLEEGASYRLGQDNLRVVVVVPMQGCISSHLRRLAFSTVFSVGALVAIVFISLCACCVRRVIFCVITPMFHKIS